MNIEISKLPVDKYPKTVEMIQKTIRTSQKEIYPTELIEKLCNKYDLEKFIKKAKEIEYWIAVEQDQQNVVGIIGLKENEVRTFFVDPKYQGQGIGRLLYEKLEEVARNRRISKLVLFSSPLGEPAYVKFGFIKVKSVVKELDGLQFVDAYMEKKLE